MLTQELVKELLDYNSATGDLTWKIALSNRIKVGDIAGCLSGRGYLRVRINHKLYLAHRIIWLGYYGYMPEQGIDHINRKPADNRICNLREVSVQCNARNCGNWRNNTSGVKGVVWHKPPKKWAARIKVDFALKSLGLYTSFDDAVCARLAAEQCLAWAGCDSESPAFKYVRDNVQGESKL